MQRPGRMKEKSIHQPEQVWGEGSDGGGKRERERKGRMKEKGRGKAGQEKARGDESNYEKRATRRGEDSSRERGNASKKSYILDDVTKRQRTLRVRIRYVSKYCNRERKSTVRAYAAGRMEMMCSEMEIAHNCRYKPKNQMCKRIIIPK